MPGASLGHLPRPPSALSEVPTPALPADQDSVSPHPRHSPGSVTITLRGASPPDLCKKLTTQCRTVFTMTRKQIPSKAGRQKSPDSTLPVKSLTQTTLSSGGNLQAVSPDGTGWRHWQHERPVEEPRQPRALTPGDPPGTLAMCGHLWLSHQEAPGIKWVGPGRLLHTPQHPG